MFRISLLQLMKLEKLWTTASNQNVNHKKINWNLDYKFKDFYLESYIWDIGWCYVHAWDSVFQPSMCMQMA